MGDWRCVADPDGAGMAWCDVCDELFDSDSTHLELATELGPVVVCADCVPGLIGFAEQEGPPGLAAVLLEVWVS